MTPVAKNESALVVPFNLGTSMSARFVNAITDVSLETPGDEAYDCPLNNFIKLSNPLVPI